MTCVKGRTADLVPRPFSKHWKPTPEVGEAFTTASAEAQQRVDYSVWRHTPDDNSARMPVPSSTRLPPSQAVCFVDMAGFTALTEAQGDEDAAKLATRFAEITLNTLRPGERLVKSIGDAVMVTSPNPRDAVSFVERLLMRSAGLPPLRAGLHYGPTVEKKNDVFGATVNIAARVAAEAHAGEVLSTKAIADAAEQSGIPVIEIGEVLLKNVTGAISLYSLGLVLGASETPVDPVCHLPIDRRAAIGNVKHRGKEYWFCSMTCIAAFASNPGWHVANEEQRAKEQ